MFIEKSLNISVYIFYHFLDIIGFGGHKIPYTMFIDEKEVLKVA